jgi:inorganic phosphate transporter, PiT family
MVKVRQPSSSPPARSPLPICTVPVSTTHVLSSGVAGTMAANGSGLQLSTLRNIVLAWVLTLPMAMMLSGGLYILFLNIF